MQLLQPLKKETYDVYLQLFDNQNKGDLTILKAIVCDCEGHVDECSIYSPQDETPVVLAVLGAFLALLSECKMLERERERTIHPLG